MHVLNGLNEVKVKVKDRAIQRQLKNNPDVVILRQTAVRGVIKLINKHRAEQRKDPGGHGQLWSLP